MSLKKKLLVGFLVFVLVLTGLVLVPYYSYSSLEWCWQCAARRNTWNFYQKVEENSWKGDIAAILGHPCRHEHWELDSYTIHGWHGDRFAHRYIPMVEFPGAKFIIAAIKLIPIPEWRRHVLLAIGNPDNGAKWVAVAALTTLGPELEWWEPPTAPEDWNIWWLTNEKYFATVTDKQQALALAKEFRNVPDKGSEF